VTILPGFLLSVPRENLSDEGESNINLYYVRALLTIAENAGVILKRLALLNAYFGIDAIKYTSDADDKTLLHEAAQYLAPKHLAILGFLIGYCIYPNYRDNDEMRAIDYAKQRGNDATSFIHYLRAITPRMDNEYYQPVLSSSLNIS